MRRLPARSPAACSTAWCTSELGTSTSSRTRLSGSSCTCVARAVTRPFKQTRFGLRPVASGPVRLFVIARHAHSTLNLEGRVNGDPSVPVALTEQGQGEARQLGIQVAHVPIDLCLHTRFSRTHDTAAIALAGRDVPLHIEPLLDDIDVGELEGRTIEEYRAWKKLHTRADAFPGGESLDDAARRYANGFRRVLERPGRCILVVCHEIALRYALHAPAGSGDLDGPVHTLRNATPYLFVEPALERAAERIDALTG